MRPYASMRRSRRNGQLRRTSSVRAGSHGQMTISSLSWPARFRIWPNGSLTKEATRLSALTEQISQLEGRADELHDEGLRALYKDYAKSDPMAFFIGNEVYDHLEKVVDRFDDVANVLHGIVIENV